MEGESIEARRTQGRTTSSVQCKGSQIQTPIRGGENECGAAAHLGFQLTKVQYVEGDGIWIQIQEVRRVILAEALANFPFQLLKVRCEERYGIWIQIQEGGQVILAEALANFLT